MNEETYEDSRRDALRDIEVHDRMQMEYAYEERREEYND